MYKVYNECVLVNLFQKILKSLLVYTFTLIAHWVSFSLVSFLDLSLKLSILIFNFNFFRWIFLYMHPLFSCLIIKNSANSFEKIHPCVTNLKLKKSLSIYHHNIFDYFVWFLLEKSHF